MQDPVKLSRGEAHITVKPILFGTERYFGPGICELLERIDDSGSIQAAARQMDMSYTKAWKILNRAEKEMNCRLITRMNGGRNGGSSSLTPDGRQAVTAFREMEQRLQREGERILGEYEDILLPRSRLRDKG